MSEKISALPAATDVTNADIPIVQGGVNKKAASSLFNNSSVTPTLSAGFETLVVKKSLTALEIQTLQSAPVDIGLPASGAGYYYRVVSFDCKLTFGSVAFTSTELHISPSTGAPQLIWDIDLSIGVTVFASSRDYSVLTDNIIENDTLVLISDADSAVGDSTIDCYITVQKVKM